jgi:hypothetical protein
MCRRSLEDHLVVGIVEFQDTVVPVGVQVTTYPGILTISWSLQYTEPTGETTRDLIIGASCSVDFKYANASDDQTGY